MLCLVPLSAQALTLDFPVACELGHDCFIQNYFDHDPTTGMADYRCGTDVYEDGHDGIDIRLRDGDAMRAGMAVKAAADGTVFNLRDGMEDKPSSGAHDAQHRDCGNAVVLTHADGYQTSYCHLRQGSVRVTQGQAVHRGDVLGMVGMSGFANFPHVHFMLRRDKHAIDPFTGTDQGTACNTNVNSLWASPLAYATTTLLNDGWTDHAPDKAAMRDHPARMDSATPNAPALIYWVDVMHLQADDHVMLRLDGPGGTVLVPEHDERVESTQPLAFRFVGARAHQPWPTGEYRASLHVLRGGATVLETTKILLVK